MGEGGGGQLKGQSPQITKGKPGYLLSLMCSVSWRRRRPPDWCFICIRVNPAEQKAALEWRRIFVRPGSSCHPETHYKSISNWARPHTFGSASVCVCVWYSSKLDHQSNKGSRKRKKYPRNKTKAGKQHVALFNWPLRGECVLVFVRPRRRPTTLCSGHYLTLIVDFQGAEVYWDFLTRRRDIRGHSVTWLQVLQT